MSVPLVHLLVLICMQSDPEYYECPLERCRSNHNNLQMHRDFQMSLNVILILYRLCVFLIYQHVHIAFLNKIFLRQKLWLI